MNTMKENCSSENCSAYDKIGLLCGGECERCEVPKIIDKIFIDHFKNLEQTDLCLR